MTTVKVERLLTVPEIVEATQRSASSVWADIREGRLQSLRFGRSVRVHPDDLADYFERAKRGELEPS